MGQVRTTTFASRPTMSPGPISCSDGFAVSSALELNCTLMAATVVVSAPLVLTAVARPRRIHE